MVGHRQSEFITGNISQSGLILSNKMQQFMSYQSRYTEVPYDS